MTALGPMPRMPCIREDMGGALEDRITAEHDYRVNQLALQHLIAWHRDAHAPDCPCVRRVGSAAEGLLTELSRDL